MFFSAAAITALIFVSACTKEGPQGPPGEDGNATCGTCHDNSETVEIKIAQWGHSLHGFGGTNFENRTTCAPCHTSQGFKEALANDTTGTVAPIENPASINCYTCHQIHDTYSADDWNLRVTTPSTFWLAGTTAPDLGNSNICLKCHQPRTSYAVPDVNNPEGTYEVTSTRFAPHYGAQGAIVSGTALYLVGSGYMNGTHAGMADACNTCHMADPIGYVAGGHTWKMEDEEEGFNYNGCLECHTAEEAATLVEELDAEILDLMTQLGTILATEGIYNPNGTSGYAVKGTYTNKVAGAYWNFISVMYDGSTGVHNPKFVKKLLENTIASLQ